MIDLKYIKNINGVETKYYLQGTNIIAEEKNGQTIHYIYNEQNQLVGFEHQQSKYFYVRDLLGVIRNIIDINGKIVVTYKYDAWGNHKVYDSSNAENTSSSFVGNINPFRYKGYYYDVETGWYLYLQRRTFYLSFLGRYINSKDLNELDLFIHHDNKPIMIDLVQKETLGLSISDVINNVHATQNTLDLKYIANNIGGNWWKQNTYTKFVGSFWYREGMGRFEWKLPKDKAQTTKIGYFEKTSVYNLQGQVGFGSLGDNIVGIKGVVDVGTITGLLGVIINPEDTTYFMGLDVGVAVATGRVGLTIGNNFEVGVW
ncbi:MAG: hypothetical protein WCZ13_01615, partial [Acholeplasmataceae bacterium]